ncbi:hypothetical protein ACQ3I4_11620 [Zafaria sp. Z1313]|uniref:hypothetical protein n=1 Tax=unclassified Zafaria TaxID=2828765 RepID=UPI002E78D584|nr:hypothetical protein [Zafaria sp. J156]MEE1622074.1 hypothetical protein [Zafaria sp. J156]
MIAAVAGALGTTLLDLTWQVAAELRGARVLVRAPSAAIPPAPAAAASTRTTPVPGSVPVLALAA